MSDLKCSNSFPVPLSQRSKTSLQSIGEYSRYPLHRGLRVVTSIACLSGRAGSQVDEVSDIGSIFDSEDPECGFSPYCEGGIAVEFPTIDEKEDDDALHNPDADEGVGPGYKRMAIVIFTCVTFVSGLFILFVVWPVLTYGGYGLLEGGYGGERPLKKQPLSNSDHLLLRNVRSTLVDPHTPESALTRGSVFGKGNLKLVFSDEFNIDGRSFYEGDDPFWQAVDLHYAVTHDLEWYDPDAVTTRDGTLRIRLDVFRNHDLNYRSGMIQSWNKLCFKGGVLEVSASLPGPPSVPGLWPGIWTIGNLARPGYAATTEGVWPYSYNNCDLGITPNQSSFDGLSSLPGQKLASCVCAGEDHPNPGTGRGAPEIDVLEATADGDPNSGAVTQSYQLAPFDAWYKPDYDHLAINNPNVTKINPWKGGPFQQAISGVTALNNEWYHKHQYQKYSFEYIPGEEDGAIAWFVGDEETFRVLGPAIGPNGNISHREVSREPMSITMDLAFSASWSLTGQADLRPTLEEGVTLYIDYVRVYQQEGEESITCDPPGYPTTDYIAKHPKAYTNSSFTSWGGTGYPWPKSKMVQGC
ncbi:beta-glucan synthesis-associated [Tuber brumale]|nr:beta-glucan synthesis-associated [Tuber brumale]